MAGMQGRAPNMADYFQMWRTARNTPIQQPRDLEGENRLRLAIIQSIADLEKTKADIKKGVISGMTDMATKFAATQADMLSALAAEADAQAKTAAAKADIWEYTNKVYANARGAIAAGTPEEDFMKGFADPATGLAANQSAMSSSLSDPNSETAQLYAELAPAAGSPSMVGPGFDAFVDALDQQFVSGPGGMVSKAQTLLRGSNQQALVPNSYGAMRQIDTAIASALQSAKGKVPDEVLQQVYAELRTRAAGQLQNAVVQAAGDANIYTNFAQTQSQAKEEMLRQANEQVGKLGVGINAKTKKALLDNNQKIIGLITVDDPFAQTQVAKDRLAAKGYTEPKPLPAGADPDVQKAWDLQKKAYDDALRQEVAATIPMEGFAKRLADLPVSPEIDEQIKYLKSQLGAIGKVTPDRLSAATYALRQTMGDEQFTAWSRLVGAATDEAAAIAAAQDPTKLAVFRRVAGTEKNALTNPEQYRKVVATEAANEAGAAKQAAKESAAAYAAEGEAVVQPQLPSEPAPSRGSVVPRTPEEQAARDASTPAFPTAKPIDIAPVQAIPTKFDVSKWSQGIDEAIGAAPTQPAPGTTPTQPIPQVAMPSPLQQALTTTTGARSQLFGPQGFLAQRARGITG